MQYTTQSPLMHNGQRIAVGAQVDLDQATAAPLSAVGCIVPVQASQTKAPAPAAAPAAKPAAKGRK